MRGLQYIGAGLQYIGAPEFYFQNSGKDWGGRALIKPGFVYHMMAQLMDWKPFVCRVSCSKIKQKTCLLNRRGSNIMEPRLQYIGAHQICFLHNRLVNQKYFFAITPMRFNKTQSIWIGLIQLRKWFSMSHKIMFRNVVVKGLQYNGARAPIYWSP